jgi:hypothetical protein
MSNSKQAVKPPAAGKAGKRRGPLVPDPAPQEAGGPVAAVEKLKAERVQEPLEVAQQVTRKRVQARLKTWDLTPDRKAVHRTRLFADAATAASYAHYAVQVVLAQGHAVTVRAAPGVVGLTLHGPLTHGFPGRVTEETLNLADRLG